MLQISVTRVWLFYGKHILSYFEIVTRQSFKFCRHKQLSMSFHQNYLLFIKLSTTLSLSLPHKVFSRTSTHNGLCCQMRVLNTKYVTFASEASR